MNLKLSTILTLSFYFLLFSPSAYAQYRIGLVPRTSPTKTTTNTIGFANVGITYSSPKVKERNIWGDLVPYDQIWRAGANEATKVSFSEDVYFQEQLIKAGEYALFIIPREHDKWTIILSGKSNQWGSFSYSEQEDVLRLSILPRFNVNYTEDLTYEIHDIGFDFGIIRLLWENLELEIEFRSNLLEDLTTKINGTADTIALEEQWVVYLQGAEFLTQRKQNTMQAIKWLDKSENLFNSHAKKYHKNASYFLGHIYYTKATALLNVEGSKDEAKTYLNKMKMIDNGKGYFTRKIGAENFEKLINSL